MPRLSLLFVALLVLPLLGSDWPKDNGDAAELDDLQGTWRWISTSEGGQVQKVLDGQFLTFRDNRYEWTGQGFCPAGVYKIDRRRRPALLDMTRTTGPETGRATYRYLYRIDGDTLTSAASEDHRERPSSLGGAGVLLLTYKRVKK